jgi:predicted acylesterase/phospholipase RssA
MRLGLSLSGGGFRATLFHLGVVRFLRDAGMLGEVSNIVSVSGGSILAAHMALNWQRYNSTEKDFDDAAAEILRFVSFDLRNCIVRRIPFQLPQRWLSALLRRGFHRGLTVNGLMEHYLDRYLYGGRCVHELPARPMLHILTTNVSEGGLCAFSRDGIHWQQRTPGEPDHVETMPAQLTPIAMAVAASAAFPGFFPPVRISAADVGAQEGQLPLLTLTDGGVYDNLGVRAFYWNRKMWTESNLTLTAADLDPRVLSVLGSVGESSLPALCWLANQLPAAVRTALSQTSTQSRPELLAEMAAALSTVLKLHRFQEKSEFDSVAIQEAPAALLARARNGETLDPGSQAWLNRHLLASALKQAAGGDVLPASLPGFDEIIVSDAGQPFLVVADPSLGFIAQSIRATDIMWDRIWQLEQDNFGKDPQFRFVPVHRLVSRDEDPTALHPTIQAEIPMIRTDLDRFSPLESRALAMHGYEVARSICLNRLTESKSSVRTLPPWNPYASSSVGQSAAASGSQVTADARSLRRSAQRRIWSTLFDWRDWPTYVFVPLLIFLVGVLPVLTWRFYQHSVMHATVVNAVAQGMPDFRKAMELIEHGPHQNWKAEPVERVAALKEIDYKGWELVNDTRILDLRGIEPSGWFNRTPPHYYVCNILRIRKLPTYQGDGKLTLIYPFRGSAPEVRVPSREYQPVVQQLKGDVEVHDQPGSMTQIEFNLAHVPNGDSVNLECEFLFRDVSQVKGYWVRYKPMMPTKMSNVWLLFPSNHPYRNYKLRSFVAGQPGSPENEEPRYLIDHPLGLVIAWSLTNPKDERTYECQWTTE